MKTDEQQFVAFCDNELVVRGNFRALVKAVKPLSGKTVLIFNEGDGKQVDFDMRGTVDEICRAYEQPFVSVGRPKLGVAAREVTLLPRHWAWLENQPKGASASLRRLVDAAMQVEQPAEINIDALYRIMSAIAGDQPGFEEATRALYKKNWDDFRKHMKKWPKDVRDYLQSSL